MIALNLHETFLAQEAERRADEQRRLSAEQRRAQEQAYRDAANRYQDAWSQYSAYVPPSPEAERTFYGYRLYEYPPFMPPTQAARMPQWARTLQLTWPTTRAMAESSWRKLAQKAHPDHGGSNAQMAQLNAAIAEARKCLK